MPAKEYLLFFDIDTRKRHYHLSESGKIIKFVVQLEIKINNEWNQVICYDCAHDFTHKDCYNIKGKKRKISLYLDFENALTFSDEDINENWELYRKKFLRGDFP